MPMVPILVCINVLGLVSIKSHIFRKSSWVVLTVLLVFNLASLFSRFGSEATREYLFGEMGRKEYLRHQLPEYPVQEFANAHLSSKDKILFVYLGFRGYYCDIPYTYDFHDDLRTFRRWLVGAKSNKTISDQAKMEGINYLMLHRGFLKQALEGDFDQKRFDTNLLKEFFEKDTEIVFSQGPIDLVAIH